MSLSTAPSKTCGPPPPAAVYAELSTAITAIQGHAKCNGYALFKRDTKPNRIVYTCDRYGKPAARPKNPDLHDSKRRVGSRSKKCDCQMKVALTKDKITGSWQLQVLKGDHNHDASTDPSAHPMYRIAALDPTIRAQIESLAVSGLGNAQILAVLYHQHPEVILSQKDVSNIVQATRLKELGGLTPIEWLLRVCIYKDTLLYSANNLLATTRPRFFSSI
jgi:hypothetical protein